MATHTQREWNHCLPQYTKIDKNDNQTDKQNQNNSQIADRHRPKLIHTNMELTAPNNNKSRDRKVSHTVLLAVWILVGLQYILGP